MRYTAIIVAFLFIVVSSAWIASAFVDVPFIPEAEPATTADPSIRERLDARFQTRDIAIITGGAIITAILLYSAQRSLNASNTGTNSDHASPSSPSRARSAGRDTIAPPILPGPRLSIQEKIQVLRQQQKDQNELDTASMRAITLQRQLLEDSNLPHLAEEDFSTPPPRRSNT